MAQLDRMLAHMADRCRSPIGVGIQYKPGFLTKPVEGERREDMDRLRARRVSAGLCPLCGRPMRVLAPPAHGEARWMCVPCQHLEVAKAGSRLYALARRLVP